MDHEPLRARVPTGLDGIGLAAGGCAAACSRQDRIWRAAWNEPGVVLFRGQPGLGRDPARRNGMACPNTRGDGAGNWVPGGVRHPGTVLRRIGVGGVEAAPRIQFRTSYGEPPEERLLMGRSFAAV